MWTWDRLPLDVVLKVDDSFIHNTIELSEYIYSHTGQRITLEVQRGGEHLSIPLIPRTEWPENEGAAGFFTTNVIVRYPLLPALRRAVDQMLVMIQETVHQTIRLARGQASLDDVRITGPIGLKTVSDQAVENAIDWGEWFPVLYLSAWISIALGLTNLLPLPALDGGRALFVGIEIVRGKRVSMKIEKIIHAVGLIALLILLAVLTVNDILNPYS